MKEKCRCGHSRGMHMNDRDFCTADGCMNVCYGYAVIVLPGPGERPVFGVHHLDPEEAWTPEPLSGYWEQEEPWKP